MEQRMSTDTIRRRETFKRLATLFLAGICLLAECLIFTYFWRRHFVEGLVQDLEFDRNWHVLQIAIYGVLLLFFSRTYGGFHLGYLKNSEIVFSQMIATLAVNVFLYGEVSLMANHLFAPRYFVEMTLIQAVAVFFWAMASNRLYQAAFPPRRLLLVHGSRPIESIRGKLESRKDKYEVAGCAHIGAGTAALQEKILSGCEKGDFDSVVLWDIPTRERKELLKFCYVHSIRIYIMPKITDVILMGAEEMHLFDTPILLTREYCLTMEQKFMKRFLDLVCASVLLVLSSPFMLLTALAVRLYDGGPALCRQVRCTIGGKRFTMLKFRSMGPEPSEEGNAGPAVLPAGERQAGEGPAGERQAGEGQAGEGPAGERQAGEGPAWKRPARKRPAEQCAGRITPVGKFIRKVRLDELPQLFNILKGDMTFIGPRPERPDIMAQYVEIMPEFAYRLKVKAGLAGYAQVYGKYNTAPYDKLKLDLTYIEKYSLWLDIKLMLLTLKILFWSDGKDGTEQEQVTAFAEECGREARKHD